MRPRDQAEAAGGVAQRAGRGAAPEIENAGVPLAGGLVGFIDYDVVRYFERLPQHATADADCARSLHYVAPRSLLVFDHLTRRVALLHAGTEQERQSLRREVIRALRGGLPGAGVAGEVQRAEASLSQDEFLHGVARTQEYIAAGDVYQLVLSSRFGGRCDARPVPGLSRAAADQSVAVHVLLRARRASSSSAPRPRRW